MAGKFKLIYIDPCWPYNEPGFRKAGKEQGVANIAYDTMEFHELVGFKTMIDKWSARNCLMLMWATAPRLDMARDLLPLWGYRYVTVGFVWVKTKQNPDQLLIPGMDVAAFAQSMLATDLRKGMGFHTSIETEYCLLAKRGKPGAAEIRMVDQVVFAPIREHSRKPDEVAERIERIFPSLVPRIEVFARRRRPSWITWGNALGNVWVPGFERMELDVSV
jgi:N6-adenosine-specific RNA methylase IME4